MQNELIRCFIAIPIPESIIVEIEKYIRILKNVCPKIRWVKARNIHLTLKFLGEITPKLVQEIKNALHPINEVKNFELTIGSSGAFPNENRPRVIWLGLSSDNNSILTLHQWIEKEFVRFGFEKEGRRLSPHLTLGRVKEPDNFNDLFLFFKKHPFPHQSFSVNEIILMKSKLSPAGAEYSPIQIYPL